MNTNETLDDLKRVRFEHIDRRWKQLYELERETGLTALQYLFLTNSGGAAATLAFIGAIGITKIGVGAKCSLALFVLGIILSGISRAKHYHHMSKVFKNWKALVQDYYDNRKSWEIITALDKQIAVGGFWDYAIPYGSFACFIIGSLIGFIALI